MLNAADDKDIQTDFIHRITFSSKVKLNIIIVYEKKKYINKLNNYHNLVLVFYPL